MAVEAASGPAVTQRLDKWLWCVRVAKTRTQAAALVSSGKVRVNRVKTDKPAHAVKIGDVITASVGPRVRVLAVKGIGERRGSAEVARTLFDDLTAPASPAGGDAAKGLANEMASHGASGERQPGAGRPTKRDRRLIDRLKGEV
jgi:ribosome-associated heat shock protein Hsp15